MDKHTKIEKGKRCVKTQFLQDIGIIQQLFVRTFSQYIDNNDTANKLFLEKLIVSIELVFL